MFRFDNFINNKIMNIKIASIFVVLTFFFSFQTKAQLEPVDLTWDSLKVEFNQMSAFPRIISVFGVKSPQNKAHRDAMRDQVLGACNNPDLRWIIIWFEDFGNPAVRSDADIQAALTTDSRVKQWWYYEHQIPPPKNDSIALQLGASPWANNCYAYDMSMLFLPGVMWTDTVMPMPNHCMERQGLCCSAYDITAFKDAVDSLGVCDTSVGINDPNLNQNIKFQLSPNPNNGSFTIDINSISQGVILIDIVNIYGQRIESIISKVKNSGYWQQITIDDLPNGIYYARINLGNKQITKQFCVIR